MTMTPAVVNGAAMRVVLVTEPSKADAMRRWINGDTTVPVSRVRRSNAVIVATSGVLP
jgi:6-phosphogluconolactonase/glucosamine-6-phosphate isomerase/deaminase